MARVLVTGEGGYIGRHLAPRLRQDGHEVWGLYRNRPKLPSDTRIYELWDLSLGPDFDYAARGRNKPDVVIHLAGRIDIRLAPNPKGNEYPPLPDHCEIDALYKDNVVATANVVQYCLTNGVKHLVFASTQAVYGTAKKFDEATDEFIPSPLEHYATSKLSAEMVVKTARRQGLCASILRLPGVYGGDRKSGTIYDMCREALTKNVIHSGYPLPVPYTALHIDDVVDALALAAAWTPPNTHWSEGFDEIITDNEPCSLALLADQIAALVPGCTVKHGRSWAPIIFKRNGILQWTPKPREKRLRQMLEEVAKDER